MLVENRLFREVDNHRDDTSMQTCRRDQRKVGHLIDQIKILADNLDELRVEIGALKNNFAKDRDHLSRRCCGEAKNSRTNIFNKLKKYAKKIRSIDFLKDGGSSTNTRKGRYSSTDSRVPSLFSYIFRFGKSDVYEVPTKIKYLKDECSQTENSQRIFALSIAESPVPSKYMGNSLQSGNSLPECGSEQYDKIVFPTKLATYLPESSEISCKLSFRVEDSLDLKDISKNMKVALPKDKQLASSSTQTKMPKARRRHRNYDFQTEYPRMYFSRIKDAVITRKMIRDPKNSKFRMIEKGRHLQDYPYLKKKVYKIYSANGKGTNGMIETIGHEVSEEKYFYDEETRRLDSIPSINDSNVEHDLSSEVEVEAASSTSISVNLELHVSDSSNQESLPSRKPRTYTINKKTQKRNQSEWLDQVERNIVYVGSTSHLNLSTHSLSN